MADRESLAPARADDGKTCRCRVSVGSASPTSLSRGGPGRAGAHEIPRRECAEEPELRAELDSLLALGRTGLGLSEAAPLKFHVTCFRNGRRSKGQAFGAYRIIREIGRGGLGTVYLAERADEAFRQKVALKVVRRGLDTEDILRRFRHERQILAQLEHPNIARLLDAGSTRRRSALFRDGICGREDAARLLRRAARAHERAT